MKQRRKRGERYYTPRSDVRATRFLKDQQSITEHKETVTRLFVFFISETATRISIKLSTGVYIRYCQANSISVPIHAM